jgi:hypothetical protein
MNLRGSCCGASGTLVKDADLAVLRELPNLESLDILQGQFALREAGS